MGPRLPCNLVGTSSTTTNCTTWVSTPMIKNLHPMHWFNALGIVHGLFTSIKFLKKLAWFLWKRKIYSTRGPLNLCPSSIFPKEKKIKGPSCKAPMAPLFGYPLNSGDKKKKCGPIIKLCLILIYGYEISYTFCLHHSGNCITKLIFSSPSKLGFNGYR